MLTFIARRLLPTKTRIMDAVRHGQAALLKSEATAGPLIAVPDYLSRGPCGRSGFGQLRS